ncbi:MAG: hypothetical protein JXR80_09345 [Deltaproteobacteria bacterium]|nr:hypothetical protein [Deltaproteobacteria bacterium]
MRQSSVLLFFGVVVIGVVLVNLYLVQPRLALHLPVPEPPPTIEQMPSPPPAQQVATTMDLIREMAALKAEVRAPLPVREALRNPFLAAETAARKAPSAGSESADREVFLPQVQMLMIGEQQRSALLDNVLVYEGEFFKGYRITRITEAGVSLLSSGKTVLAPLGVYTTATLSLPEAKKKVKTVSENVAPEKQKAALSELMRRLEPLLTTDKKSVKND